MIPLGQVLVAWAVTAWLLGVIGAVKREGHPGRAAFHPLDLGVLLVLAAAGPATGSKPLAILSAAVTFALFGALWLDAVLYRVYSMELGLTGVRGIVLPVLYRELSEVTFARRFLARRRAFLLTPLVAAAAQLSSVLPPEGRPVLALVLIALAAWITLEARVFPRGRGAGESALASFVLPRRLIAPRDFQPRPEHRELVEPVRLQPRPSAHHGLARGADVLLWTFESLGRVALEEARMPFLRSLLEECASAERHFALCPMTTEAHRTLYTSGYLGDDPSGVGVLHNAGYRCLYLTPYRTTHYALAATLARAGFDAIIDRTGLTSGRDSELPGRGLELVLKGATGPLFAHVHTANSHLPYLVEAPELHPDRDLDDDRQRYLASLEEADAVLGAFYARWTRERGKPPLLCVSSDHGQSFGEHGYRSHGSAITREQVEVPLVLHHAGLPRSKWRWSSHLDVLPTLLDLVGVGDGRGHLGDSVFNPRGEPALILWAGHPARSTTSNLGLLHGSKKYLADLVLGRCEELDWDDRGRSLEGEERRYVQSLIGRAFARAGLQ